MGAAPGALLGKWRRNHWSQEAARQTGFLPGCRWHRHSRHIPGLLPALLSQGSSCTSSCCPLGPCQTFAVLAMSSGTLPGVQVLAVGLGSPFHPVAAPLVLAAEWVLGSLQDLELSSPSPRPCLPDSEGWHLPWHPQAAESPRPNQSSRGTRRAQTPVEAGRRIHLGTSLPAPQESTGQGHRVPVPPAWGWHRARKPRVGHETPVLQAVGSAGGGETRTKESG